MATAAELGLSGPEAKLYDLIWKRTVSTQMADAKIAMTTVRIETVDTETGESLTFRSSGRQVVFPGFFRAYVEGTDDPEAVLEDRDQPLPALEVGEALNCNALDAVGHETRPPARYTVATLVKSLETEGIGRPSTYASIIDTIQRRGYVRNERKQLIPTFTAMAVTQLLEQTLGKVVDVDFTASMEAWLDQIAVGQDAQEYLAQFYETDLLSCISKGEQIEARSVCTLKYEGIEPYRIRLGKFGPFIEYDVDGEEKPRSVTLPEEVGPADVDLAFIETLKAQQARAEAPLGTDPETGKNVYVKKGRFGPYVQLGEVVDGEKPHRSSLPPGVDLATIDLATALRVLSLPRQLGVHPDDGEPIMANVGRYGPYVQHLRTFASVKEPDNVMDIELDRALVLIAEKLASKKAPEALKELGAHPEDGKPILVMEGRYGPYVKHGRTNATITGEHSVETITLEQAVGLIAERKKRGKKKSGGRRRTAKS